MADTHRRILERQAVQGDQEAQAKLLLERVRIGELTLDRLRLAAYLGDVGARFALSDDAPRSVFELEAWTRGLGGWGREVSARAAMVAAELALPAWDGINHLLGAQSPHECVDAARDWLKCPCPNHAEQARKAARAFALKGAGNQVLELVLNMGTAEDAHLADLQVAGREAGEAARCAAKTVFVADFAAWAGFAVRSARRARRSAELRRGMVHHLLDWAMNAG